MKISIIDQRDTLEPKTSEYNVVVTSDFQNAFHFKSRDLPPPALGRRFFIAGREIQVQELRMSVEEGSAMYYFSAVFVPQP